jgi:hypothetical protein
MRGWWPFGRKTAPASLPPPSKEQPVAINLALYLEVLKDAETFVAGQPITVQVPAESYTQEITTGLSVKISEPGMVVTIQKV